MYVTPEILAITAPPFADTEDGERLAEFGQMLDAFSEYSVITVTEDPDGKPRDVMLARVHDVKNEFWSIRVTDPEQHSAGIRVIGAFAGVDEFVALHWARREDMRPFDDDVRHAQEIWHDLFGSTGPHSGKSLDDYLSNYRRVRT